MKKFFLGVFLALQMFGTAAQAQDIKVYEEKIQGYEKEVENLFAEFGVLKTKAPDTWTEAEKEKARQLEEKFMKISEEYVKTSREVIEKFKTTKIPAKYIAGIMDDLTFEELEALLDPKAAYYNEPELEPVKEYYKNISLRRPGTMYKDLEMEDMAGKKVKLSDWVGKSQYLFVDFWASWCGPCRQEMPNVVEAYNKYKSKGLEIIGVSFDNKKDAWVASVEKLGMKWPQMSDLKGWQSAATKAYGIRSIPSNVLLDKEGKIVAFDLRGEDLQNKLAELFK